MQANMCDKLTGDCHFLKIVGAANGFNTARLLYLPFSSNMSAVKCSEHKQLLFLRTNFTGAFLFTLSSHKRCNSERLCASGNLEIN